MISMQPSAREQGIIRFYSADEGRGFVTAGTRDYQFQVTDVVGTLGPELGDRVAFSVQLINERQFARKIVLDRNPQFIDVNKSSSEASRSLDLKRPRAPSKQTPIEPEVTPRASAYLRCQACHRLVVPKRVRSRSGFGSGATPGWRCYCPHCKTRQLETGRHAPKPARLLLGLLFAGLMIGGGLSLL